MMTGRRVVLLVAVFLTGLSAGFFFTYEASVTKGLAEVDDSTYVATFQAINRTIRNPWFAIVFFGAAPAIAAALVVNWQTSAVVRWLVGGGLALYLACIAITGTGNVPLNNELAELADITPAAAAQGRDDFEADWNRLNLIRTIAVVASFTLLTTAVGLPMTSEEIRRRPGPPDIALEPLTQAEAAEQDHRLFTEMMFGGRTVRP